jgi:hypothetical protein
MNISFDEIGHGYYDDGIGFPFGLGYVIDAPPVGHETLCFILPYSVAEGDVVLYEDASFQVVSDVLRFVNVGDTTAPIGRVYVYSDLPEAGELPPYDLADTGIPTSFMNNMVQVDEEGTEGGWNGVSYTPQLVVGAPSQPGYMDGGVTYNFTSDVPEPATICLLGLGALSLLRRRKNS